MDAKLCRVPTDSEKTEALRPSPMRMRLGVVAAWQK